MFRKFTPKFFNRIKTFKLKCYVPLAINRGFVVYQTKLHMTCSIVVLNNNHHKFIGDQNHIFQKNDAEFSFDTCMVRVYYLADRMLAVHFNKLRTRKELQIYEVTQTLSSIHIQHAIEVPKKAKDFYLIDNELILPIHTRFSDAPRGPGCGLDNFMKINLKDKFSLTTIENSSLLIQCNVPEDLPQTGHSVSSIAFNHYVLNSMF